MNLKQLELIRNTLLRVGAPTTVIREALTLLAQTDHKGSPFKAKRQPLIDALRALKNAESRWRANRKDVYGAYKQLLERVLAEMAHDERTHQTPEAVQKYAATVNAQRVEEGKRPLGSKDGHWSTWIPPHIREATILAFDQLYASETTLGLPPGRRVIPFSTVSQRGQLREKWMALLSQLGQHISAGDTLHPALVEEQTRYLPDTAMRDVTAQALINVHRERYRAAFTASRIIKARMKSVTTDLTPPLHWVHVLEEPERLRLRQAELAVPGGDGWTRASLGRLPDANRDLLRVNKPDPAAPPLPEIRTTGEPTPTPAASNGQADQAADTADEDTTNP